MTRPSIRHDILMTMTGALLLLAFSEPVRSQELGGDVMAGKTIYERHCARCHGAGGWGDGPFAQEESIPPANFHSPIIQSRSDEQMVTAIESGLAMSKMHGWRGRLNEQEMRDVVSYIRLLTQRAR
ncbi:MAG: cytochrome c [Nitrospirae bacterium]|nr:cytochrome c [Nitrospirota bacterium]